MSEFKKVDVLSHDTVDANGWKASGSVKIGQRLEHLGNKKVYVVKGYCWLGETDTWGFRAAEENNSAAVDIVRPLEHLYGNRSDGAKRYNWL